MVYIFLLFPFNLWRNQGTERWNKLPKVTWLYPFNILVYHFIDGKIVVISNMYIKCDYKVIRLWNHNCSWQRGSTLTRTGVDELCLSCLMLWIKFYWPTAMPTCLYTLYGFFLATTAELSCCDKTIWPTRPKICTVWPFTGNVYSPPN